MKREQKTMLLPQDVIQEGQAIMEEQREMGNNIDGWARLLMWLMDEVRGTTYSKRVKGRGQYVRPSKPE